MQIFILLEASDNLTQIFPLNAVEDFSKISHATESFLCKEENNKWSKSQTFSEINSNIWPWRKEKEIQLSS